MRDLVEAGCFYLLSSRKKATLLICHHLIVVFYLFLLFLKKTFQENPSSFEGEYQALSKIDLTFDSTKLNLLSLTYFNLTFYFLLFTFKKKKKPIKKASSGKCTFELNI